jgi:hypothetical protein
VAECWQATRLNGAYLSPIDGFRANDLGHQTLANAVWTSLQPRLSTWDF